MIRGRMDGAKETFKSIAKLNKLAVTNEEIDALSDDKIKAKFSVEIQREKESFKDIVASKEIMTRLIVTCTCFFTSSMLYYGLAVNSLFLPGDKYTNFIMSSVASFPGDLIAFYSLNKFGRRITLQWGYMICAAFLIAQVYVPECKFTYLLKSKFLGVLLIILVNTSSQMFIYIKPLVVFMLLQLDHSPILCLLVL